jgi:hypothetical protein
MSCDKNIDVLHSIMHYHNHDLCAAPHVRCAASQVQAVFEVTPAPRAGGEAQQSSRRLVGFARCGVSLSARAVPSSYSMCRLHAANYQLSDADLHAFSWSGRAISDGVYAALVCDIMVHPDLQASDRQLVHCPQ